MTELAAPRAARLRRPSWRDWRLLVGVVLVLGSVVLGARVVAAADDTTGVWAAARTLPAGAPITADDVTAVAVQLTGSTARYLSADEPFADDAVAVRTVAKGELLARSFVGGSGDLERQPVAIPISGSVPVDLRPGAQVDVYVSRRDAASAGSFVPPELAAQAAEVYAVSEPGSTLDVGRGAAVEVLLGEDELTDVLDALANDARIALVPRPGTAP